MSGIAGLSGAVQDRAVRAMARAISHRSPDGEGFFVDPGAGIGLAHRRAVQLASLIKPT